MKTIYEDQFFIVHYDHQKQLFKTVWTPASAEMTMDMVREAVSRVAKLTLENKPLFYLANDLKREFYYDFDMQKWVADTLGEACIKAGVKKFAVIMPQELIALLSTEQTIEEVGDINILIENFTNEAEAMAWFELEESGDE